MKLIEGKSYNAGLLYWHINNENEIFLAKFNSKNFPTSAINGLLVYALLPEESDFCAYIESQISVKEKLKNRKKILNEENIKEHMQNTYEAYIKQFPHQRKGRRNKNIRILFQSK